MDFLHFIEFFSQLPDLLPACIQSNILYNTGMQPEIAQQLLELNHQFYQTFADHFSATRQRLQPGVVRAIDSIPKSTSLLDLGCGNGRLAAFLTEKGHSGHYIGIDTSSNLIEIANQQKIPNALFFQADLAEVTWAEKLPQPNFDIILCFAVLHHIPSLALRTRFLTQVRNLLAPNGLFIHSNWQFMKSQKLRGRIQSWERIGLADDLVDDNDYLLDWRRGGAGLRYLHFFTSPELQSLAGQTGFKLKAEFSSDGASGNLGLYQIWEPQ
jgi:2-polyprenyl-3-methyl-5-hydroxy-6-metoxy-1,4-benzoquinol methylase